MRLFHSVTIFCCYICTCICCLKLHQVGEGFLNSILWGPLSSNVFTICAVYWSLGRRGYFGVSNVALVFCDNFTKTSEITRISLEITLAVFWYCQGPISLKNFNTIQMWWKFHFALTQIQSDRYKILHMTRQLCCRGMCKILLRSGDHWLNNSKAKFPSNLNLSKIPFVKRAP